MAEAIPDDDQRKPRISLRCIRATVLRGNGAFDLVAAMKRSGIEVGR